MVFETVRKIISEQFGVEEAEVTMQTTLGGLHADSLDLTELVMAVESQLNIELPDSEIRSIRTVGDLVRRARRLV